MLFRLALRRVCVRVGPVRVQAEHAMLVPTFDEEEPKLFAFDTVARRHYSPSVSMSVSMSVSKLRVDRVFWWYRDGDTVPRLRLNQHSHCVEGGGSDQLSSALSLTHTLEGNFRTIFSVGGARPSQDVRVCAPVPLDPSKASRAFSLFPLPSRSADERE